MEEKKKRTLKLKRPSENKGKKPRRAQEQPREKKAKKKSKHPILKRFCIAVIVLIVAVVGVLYGFYYQKVSLMELVKIDRNNIGINQKVKVDLSKYRNIAILGVDAQGDDYGRSDCLMVACLNKETKEVKLISIYRDTYVDVDENGTTKLDKINHAYYFGGPANTLTTINRALDLNVEEFVCADFKMVVDLVDQLGGISLNIDSEEIKYINNYIDSVASATGKSAKYITKTGVQNVNGVQAMAYCRIRYTSGLDYKRTERQRIVLSKCLEVAKSKSLTELNSIANKILPEISTNITSTEILTTLTDIMSYKISNESHGWPYRTKGYAEPTFYGVPITLESNVKQLHEDLFGQKDYEVSDTVKEMSEKIISKTGYNAETTGYDHYGTE